MKIIITLLALILITLIFGPWIFVVLAGLGTAFYFILIPILIVLALIAVFQKAKNEKAKIANDLKLKEQEQIKRNKELEVQKKNKEFTKQQMSKSKIWSKD